MRMFPLQTSRDAPSGPVSIPWAVAEMAYGEYAKRYGTSQSLERLAERGGFGWCEMDTLYPAWREEVTAVAIAVQEERAKCAETAWVMQQRDFGGGTAIGNQIASGKHLSRDGK